MAKVCFLKRGGLESGRMPPQEGSETPAPEEEATRRDRAMKDVWQRTLSQIPTTFGKVAHLASLRNENSGQYEHFGLAQLYSDEEADRVLGLSHHQVFREWLNFPLEKQRQDLENYLESLGGKRRKVLETWLTLTPYKNLLPVGAVEAERLLYISDQCCPEKVAPSDGKSRPLNVLWPVLPGNDLKSRGRKWSPERSIRTRHNEG